MSETALGVRLQLHSELQGEGFTSHPLLAENNLIFDCGSCVCVCVCVSELVQRQRKDLL